MSYHDPLAFYDEDALLTGAVPVFAVLFVALDPCDDTVVSTSSTLGLPDSALVETLVAMPISHQ